MNRPTYSVIVPVYNAQNHLYRCVDSILSQKNSDFELLLINDGSKDESGDICEKYAQKDKRICVFHKENAGVSSARNLGIREMRGKYVTFIDSDDYVDEAFLPLEEYDYDIIVQKWVFWGEYNIAFHIPEQTVSSVEEYNLFMYKYLGNHLFRSPWGKIIRSEVIVQSNLLYDEKMRLGEDTVFMMNIARNSRTVSVVNEGCYYYKQDYDWTRYNLTFSEAIYGIECYLTAFKQLPMKRSGNARFFLSFYTRLLHLNTFVEKCRWRFSPAVAELYFYAKIRTDIYKHLKLKMCYFLSSSLHMKTSYKMDNSFWKFIKGILILKSKNNNQ